METRYIVGKLWIKRGSYPTYEEWKQFFYKMPEKFTGSYPTYEEWKRLL